MADIYKYLRGLFVSATPFPSCRGTHRASSPLQMIMVFEEEELFETLAKGLKGGDAAISRLRTREERNRLYYEGPEEDVL